MYLIIFLCVWQSVQEHNVKKFIWINILIITSYVLCRQGEEYNP